jgi:amino acid transporter
LLGALKAAQKAGPASLISWVLAAFMLTFLALMYAELGATYPVAGGTARFSFIPFGPIGGFAAGWASWLQAACLAPIEVEASLTYLEPKWHGLVRVDQTLTGKGVAIAVCFIIVFTAINLAGVRILAEINRYAVLWKVAIPVLTVVALALTSFHPANFHAGGFAPFGMKGVFQALPAGVVFALLGFEQAVQLAGESRDPQRDVPRAVIFSMIIGVVIYLALEACFIGALSPGGLVDGWHHPLGLTTSYGPYAQLASSLGLGWLALLLYIDAVVSPADTGLVYVATTARISYSMGKAAVVPPAFQKIDGRRVPVFSIFFGATFGVIALLPFPSWQSLVNLVTAATAFMYGFAPVSLAALRRSDPDRDRPYRVGGAVVLAPLSFCFANLIIYWSGFSTVWHLLIGFGLGWILLGTSRYFMSGHDRAANPLFWRSSLWVFPWLIGLFVLTLLGGSYVGGHNVIPFWVDLGVVAAFSVAIFYLAYFLCLEPDEVEENLRLTQMDTSDEDLEAGVGS